MTITAENEKEARDKLEEDYGEEDYGIDFSDYTKVTSSDYDIELNSMQEIKEPE